MLEFLKILAAKLVLTEPYRWFARCVLAHFTFRIFGYTKFPMDKYWEIIDAVERKKMSNECGIFVYLAVDHLALSYVAQKIFTDCDWGHTGILDVNHLTTISMTSSGYTKRSLLDYLKTTDGFAVGFLPLKDEAAVIEAWRRIKKLDAAAADDVEYDFSLQIDQEAVEWIMSTDDIPYPEPLKIYCSEMVWLVTNGLIRDDIKELKPKWFADRTLVEPDDVAHVVGDNIIFKE